MFYKKIVKSLFVLLTIFLAAGCNSNKKDAKSYYDKGIVCLEGGSYSEAEAYFSSAISADQDKSEYYIAYGMALIKNNKFQEANEQFDKAISDKNNQIVRENNKLAYRGKGISCYLQGEYENAIEYFQKALEIKNLKEYNNDISCYLANVYYMQEDLEKAIELYDTIVKEYPKSSEAYLGKARILRDSGEIEQSIENYDKVLSYDGKKYQVYIEKYLMLVDAEKKQQADTVLTEADKAIIENSEEDTYYKALVYYYRGDVSQAIEKLSTIAAKGFGKAYSFLGDIYKEQKDYTSAAYDYEKYIENVSNCEDTVYLKLAVCYINSDKYEEALEILEKGIEIGISSNSLKELRKNLIVVYEKLLYYDRAYDLAKECIELYPDDSAFKKEFQFLETRVYNNVKNENVDKNESNEE